MWRSWAVLALPLLVTSLGAACGPTQHKSDYETWKASTESHGDFGEAEERWRRAISQSPWREQDMNHDLSLLTDAPPRAPETDGEVARQPGGAAAFAEETAEPGDDAESDTWNNVGMASFSAFTVLFTVGMAVAPYLLL
jgi:hypothetical protein